MRGCTGFIWLTVVTSGGLFWTTSSVKGGKYIKRLRDELLKKHSAIWWSHFVRRLKFVVFCDVRALTATSFFLHSVLQWSLFRWSIPRDGDRQFPKCWKLDPHWHGWLPVKTSLHRLRGKSVAFLLFTSEEEIALSVWTHQIENGRTNFH